APDPLLQGQVALPRAVDVDTLAPGRLQAVRAEAGGGARARAGAVARSQRVVERPLALASPHETVEARIEAQVVLDQGEPELARVRVAQAGAEARLAVHVDLEGLVQTGHVGAEAVLEPGDDLHPPADRESVVQGEMG